MKTTLTIQIQRAKNGFVITTRGDQGATDNGTEIATTIADIVKLTTEQINKSIAGQPAPPQQ